MENDLFYAMVWKTYHFNPGMENAIMENDVMENDVVPFNKTWVLFNKTLQAWIG